MLFLFDLDGTITTRETLPVIAEYFSKGMEIESVTNRTITGEIPFERSFPFNAVSLSALISLRISRCRRSLKCFVASGSMNLSDGLSPIMRPYAES